MGCILCDCNNELKYNNINSIEDKIDLSILNNSSFLTTSLDSTIPMSSLNYSTHIENRFFFDVNMGEGTFGFSMKIIEKPTKKEYSLKILPKDDLNKSNELKDIKQIYEYIRKILINSSHINRILSIYENEDNYFMIRDLAPLTLKRKIKNSKLPFKPKEVKNIMFQLFKSVQYLHSNNIIHGNIKPENVLFFNRNEIKLEDETHFLYFERNNKISNYIYSSPEIFENIQNEKCDEWSCGIIMFFLVCGKYPYNYNNFDDLHNKILKNKFEENIEFSKLNSVTQDLISKLLTLNPNLRFSAEDALNHKYFDKDKEDHVNENDINFNDNYVYNRNIDTMMKIYFIFIIVYNNDANINEIFVNYILGDGFEVESEKWKLVKFLNDNLICYEDENIRHIINYLYNNNIYLFGDNLKLVFDFFCNNKGDDEPVIKLKDIINTLKTLIENININNHKFTDSMIDKNLNYEEFKYFISSQL